MKRILILFAHPHFEKSRVNKALLRSLPVNKALSVHDLYELYPDFNIDIDTEKEMLKQHDVIIWHHPLYMYSAPAILKQWMDLVLEFGWAHGAGGNMLAGKIAFNVVTTGGTREAYQSSGFNSYTLGEFLRPFEQTARLCRMHYLPPFAVQGTYRLRDAELYSHAQEYLWLLGHLSVDDFDLAAMRDHAYLNDWIKDVRREHAP